MIVFRKQAWCWMQGDMARSKLKHDRHSRNTLSHKSRMSAYDRLASSVDGMRIKDLIDDDYPLNNNDVDTTSRYLPEAYPVIALTYCYWLRGRKLAGLLPFLYPVSFVCCAADTVTVFNAAQCRMLFNDVTFVNYCLPTFAAQIKLLSV